MKMPPVHMFGLKGLVRCGRRVDDVTSTLVPDEVTCRNCIRVLDRATNGNRGMGMRWKGPKGPR